MSESTLEIAAPPEGEHASSSAAPPIKVASVVPQDPWYIVRLVGFGVFVAGYVWWFVTEGLIIDRISVAISVGVFIVIGHLGRPLRRWAWLLIDVMCYCVMWLAYEETRGGADRLGFPLQVEAPRNVDRFLFFGTDPTVFLQRHFYDAYHIHWYDKVASATYFTHFIFPVIALAVLWVTSHRQWARFMKRFATLLFVACSMFVLLPTVPPWMAADRGHHYQILPVLARHTGRGFSSMGLKGFVNTWQTALDWGNAIAAMPSLHASFALFVPAFFLPRIKPIWLKALVLTFPLIMATSLVYFGEHYVIDALVGWAIVGGSFLFWGWLERRQIRQRATQAKNALMPTFAPATAS